MRELPEYLRHAKEARDAARKAYNDAPSVSTLQARTKAAEAYAEALERAKALPLTPLL